MRCVAIVKHLMNHRRFLDLRHLNDAVNAIPDPGCSVASECNTRRLAAPSRCRCIATNSQIASGPVNVPSIVACVFFSMRPCSSCTKIVINLGSRHSDANVLFARFLDRPGTFAMTSPASLTGSCCTHIHSKTCRIFVRPPSICTDTRLPCSSSPAANSRQRYSPDPLHQPSLAKLQ